MNGIYNFTEGRELLSKSSTSFFCICILFFYLKNGTSNSQEALYIWDKQPKQSDWDHKSPVE